MNLYKISLAIVTIAFFANSAFSQGVTPKEEIKATEKKTLGWNKNANLGLNFSMTSSSDVVGQTDGDSQTVGINLKGGMTKLTERTEWRNSLTVSEATTRTPSMPRYVKSADEAKLESIYLYSLESYPKVGPYVKAEVSAPLFRGEDVRAKNTTYLIGTSATPYTGSSLQLTESLKPLNTKESVGAFYKAVDNEDLKLEFRAGFGALQVQADGQLAVTGTDSSGNVLVKELSNISQGGLELGASLKGKVDEKTSYEAGVETLTPFINDKASGDDRDAVRLTNIDGFLKLTSNITSWASFGYDYKVKIQPQVVDRTQQTHMIVLNVNYNLF